VRKVIAVAAGAGAIAAIFIAAFAVNAYAASNLQFRMASEQGPSLATGSVLVEACNPTAFPVSFDEYRIDMDYGEIELATMSISGETIMPNASERLEGSIDLNWRAADVVLSSALSNIFSGKEAADTPLIAKSSVSSKVLGLIPVSDTKQIDLDKRADAPFSEEYSCD
jgi:hypothetical protein